MNAILERLTGLTLRDPAFLWLALPVAAALAIGLRRPPAVVFAHASVLDAGPGPAPPRTARAALLPLPRALHALGLLLVAFALARPAAHVLEPLEAEGSDIVLCLDTSSSMTADDLAERRSRLDVAKAAAADFVRARPDDRIGLVAFARYPDLLCPPTLDHAALRRILEDLTPVVGDGPEDATGIGAAVAQATQVLEASVARSKVVVVLTDGEENVALAGTKGEIAPAHAAQWAKRNAVRVHAVVVGAGRRAGAPAADTAPVRRMADATGGAFHEAADADALARVYAQIDALERTPFREPRFALEDRFLPFLLLALACLAVSRVLAGSVLRALP